MHIHLKFIFINQISLLLLLSHLDEFLQGATEKLLVIDCGSFQVYGPVDEKNGET
jgi:hypothetical protein